MSRIADLSKVRSPQARTAQSGPSKSKTWPRTMQTVEGSCGFVRKDSEKCGEKVGPHPPPNPANWAPFCCQWPLRRTAETLTVNVAGLGLASVDLTADGAMMVLFELPGNCPATQRNQKQGLDRHAISLRNVRVVCSHWSDTLQLVGCRTSKLSQPIPIVTAREALLRIAKGD